MALWQITSPEGRILEIEGDVEPTQNEITQLFEQHTPVVRDVAPGSLTPPDLLPAIRTIGGKIETGEPGDTHPDIIKRQEIPAVDIDQRGFTGPSGEFYDRETAAKGLQVPTEFEPGRLHSTDLINAQELPRFEAPLEITEKGPVYASQLEAEKYGSIAPSDLTLWQKLRRSDTGRKLLGPTPEERELDVIPGQEFGIVPMMLSAPLPFGPGPETKLGKAMLGGFIAQFASQAPDSWNAFQSAVQRGDWQEAGNIAVETGFGAAFTALAGKGLHEQLRQEILPREAAPRTVPSEKIERPIPEVVETKPELVTAVESTEISEPVLAAEPLKGVRVEERPITTESDVSKMSKEEQGTLNHTKGIEYGVTLTEGDVPRLEAEYKQAGKEMVKASMAGDDAGTKASFGKYNFYGGALQGATKGAHTAAAGNYARWIQEKGLKGKTAEGFTRKVTNPLSVEDISKHLESEGIAKDNPNVTIVEKPDLVELGRYDPKTGKIEINRSQIADTKDLQWVWDHERAHKFDVENPGAVAKIRNTITGPEWTKIQDEVVRAGYEASQHLRERDARVVTTLADAWRGRGWFNRLVKTVQVWAGKQGIEMDRVSAERTAVRALAEATKAIKENKWQPKMPQVEEPLRGAREEEPTKPTEPAPASRTIGLMTPELVESSIKGKTPADLTESFSQGPVTPRLEELISRPETELRRGRIGELGITVKAGNGRVWVTAEDRSGNVGVAYLKPHAGEMLLGGSWSNFADGTPQRRYAVKAAQFLVDEVAKFEGYSKSGTKYTIPEVAQLPAPAPAEVPKVAADVSQPIGIGGARAGEPAPGAQIEQLTQSLKNIQEAKMPLGQQIRESFNVGDRLSTTKSAIGRALTGLKAAGDTIISKWRGVEKIDDMLRAKGVLSEAIESRGWRLRQWEKAAKRAIPNPRDQAAIAKWVDAGGDRAALERGLAESPERFKQAYRDAIALSGDKLTAAQNIQNFFESRLQEAIDAGVLEHGIENYIHRMYESRPGLEKKALAYTQGGLLRQNPDLAKRRVFQFDWEAEKEGYVPVQSFIKRITAYEASLSKAIAAREFVKSISEMKAADGRPMVDIKGVGIPIMDPAGVYKEATLIKPKFNPAKNSQEFMPDGSKNPNYRGDYVSRDYRALQRWKWVGTDASGKPIFVQGDVAIHPDYVGRMDALLKPSQVRYGPLGKIGRPALAVGSAIKQTMLDLSGFHQVQITVHGLEHKVMPWKIIKDITLDSPDVQGLLRGGLSLGGDYHGSFREGLVGSSLTRQIPGLGNMMETYHQWLFQDYIPRLKATMALHALERNRARFGGRMPDEAIFRKTANQANAAFGELNYIMLERSKTARDMSRLILLAPDFLEARGRFAAQAFERGGKGVPLIGGNEQRMALLLGALTMYVTARVANKILDDQYHFEPENLFNIVYKGHAYGLRTVQGDILHLLNDPLKFWMSRLNPVYGRTLLEGLTGRDYFGRKRSIAEQAWDAASTVIPISLRSNRERKLWESLLNGFGVTARRWSEVDDAFKLAKNWKDKHGVPERGEFIYDPQKDVLRPLKLALNHGDEAGAAAEIKKLVDSKVYTVKKLNEYFERYGRMAFTGSAANDKKFMQSLTEDQRKTVMAAKQHKQEIAKLYRKSRGQMLQPAEPQQVEIRY